MSKQQKTPPRIFGICATEASTVAIIRRGPSDWYQLGKLDTHKKEYTAGSWLRGKIFPQRCDLAPNGRWFSYMAFHAGAQWQLGESYIAISRLPWLTALAAWGLDSTYPRGCYFTSNKSEWLIGEPDHGSAAPLRKAFGLAMHKPQQFAVERQHGWQESPAQAPQTDTWDTDREVSMQKLQPLAAEPLQLLVEGKYAAFREMDKPYWAPSDTMYSLRENHEVEILDEVQWADWSLCGHLLVATAAGELQMRVLHSLREYEIVFSYNLTSDEPCPEKPPREAEAW